MTYRHRIDRLISIYTLCIALFGYVVALTGTWATSPMYLTIALGVTIAVMMSCCILYGLKRWLVPRMFAQGGTMPIDITGIVYHHSAGRNIHEDIAFVEREVYRGLGVAMADRTAIMPEQSRMSAARTQFGSSALGVVQSRRILASMQRTSEAMARFGLTAEQVDVIVRRLTRTLKPTPKVDEKKTQEWCERWERR